MHTTNQLTPEARSVIVQLLIYRLRNSGCHCEHLRKSKFAEPCSRCRTMANAKDEFPNEYFSACEIVAKKFGAEQ